MLRLAVPVLLEQSLNLLVGYTDWWLAGHFLPGTDFKAAMGLMAYVMWLLPSLFASVAIGATALTARSVGAGDRSTAVAVTNQAVLLGSAIALVATATAWFLGPWFVMAMQLQGSAAELAQRYLWIIVPAIPAIMFEEVATACLRGAGDTVSGFVARSAVNAVNILLSTLLVLGPGPIPKLGWPGLAIGTATGYTIGGAILLCLLLRGRAGLRLARRQLVPQIDLIRRLLRIGLPGGIDVLAVLACHLAYVAIINKLGTLSAAAHGLGVQIEALAYLPGSAFQAAAATIAGQCLGAGDARRAARGVMLACIGGGAFMSAAGLLFFFGGGMLAAFFTGDPHDPTAVLTARLLKVVAVSMPSLALSTVLVGALRGAGDTRLPLVITMVGYVGVRIPGACLLAWPEVPIPAAGLSLAGFNLGVMGAWYAMVADVVLRSILLVARFWHGGWKRIRVVA